MNTCNYCGLAIEKREKELMSVYLSRKYCSHSCSLAARKEREAPKPILKTKRQPKHSFYKTRRRLTKKKEKAVKAPVVEQPPAKNFLFACALPFNIHLHNNMIAVENYVYDGY